MLKSKDFYLKNIYDTKGKKLGIIEDINIDFYNKKVLGFKCSVCGFFSKKNYIDIDDVIEINKDVIVFQSRQGNGLGLKELKNMKVVDTDGIVKGVLEDILIDDYDYSIKGIVVSSGLIDRLIKGKHIFLLEQCILGDEYILYTGKDNIMFKAIPQKMEGENEFTKA